ncbi:protein FAM221A-like [Ruditapes philippinarum]|uniref:protein FAM221A-like n=1 Tax=Ruditapes philippinarum TaxID=129788 RepID=UPI00295BB1F9|nr:protein FAM221A-like [Ruditapes philippinarum]
MTSQLYKSNGIYTSYTSTTGRDCRTMEPGTQCFCQHVYKDHKTDFEFIPKERPIRLPCRAPGCKCASYYYVPAKCCSAIKCHCKHAPEEHEEFGNFVCKRAECNKCTGFTSSLLCGCGVPICEHRMTVETGDERENRRKARKH